ncbi:hypothetical protein SEUCBS140593_003363 [Sporothrix eucalyptigena]|uniref:Uncharacterized protein n=1 Tax=Sporothrix eucalyptigena TaxID=1812306 RepID=A0ABP0BE43_9PEZI
MPQIPTSGTERGPRSLKRMALAVALRNIASITDVGEMAFADAKPILMHIENPQQLHLLETNCPQLADEPDEMAAVWSRLLTKKLPGWDTKGYLSEEDLQTMSWIDIYTTVKTAVDEAMAADEARLKQTLAGFSKAKEDNATQLVNNRALTRQMPGVMTKRRVPGGSNGPSSILNFGSGSRTKMTTGQSVLRRARREAKEISKVAQLSSRLTDNQAVARSQIRRPPAAMINDYRVAHNPGTGIIRAPKKRVGSSSSLQSHYETQGRGGVPGTGLGTGNAANEARLLALKSGGTAAAPPSTYTVKAGMAIHAPKKRALASDSPPKSSTKRRTYDDDHDDEEEGSYSRKPASKSSKHDYDDDDELFGVVTKPSKRARLTVEDLEGGGSGNDDDLFGSEEETKPKAKPKQKSSESSSSRIPDRSRSASGSNNRDGERERERYRPRPERREERSSAALPSKTINKPRPSIPAPPPTALAGSPPRRPVDGGLPKKKVDIFMRPKKR